MNTSDACLARLDSVEARLSAAAFREPAPDEITSADPESGERWDRGQVWAHLSEFIPYWIQQAGPVLRGHPSGEPVPFGRTKADPERIGAIERSRRESIGVLWADTSGDIAQLRGFLAGMEPDQWHIRGLHPTLGAMTVDDLVERFLVGHLEEHADQLEGMTPAAV
jgi:hypothetical protein